MVPERDGAGRPTRGEVTMRRAAILASLLLALAALAPGRSLAAPAAHTVLVQYRANDPETKAYLRGLLEGIQATNALSDLRGGARSYCAPDDAVITTDRVAAILGAFTERHGFHAQSAGLVLGFALADAFPCR